MFCDCLCPASVRLGARFPHTALCCYATLFQTPAADPYSFLPATTPTPMSAIITQHPPSRSETPPPSIFSPSYTLAHSLPNGRACARESSGQCRFGTQHSPPRSFRPAMIASSFHQPYRLRCRYGLQHSTSGQLRVAPAVCHVPAPTYAAHSYSVILDQTSLIKTPPASSDSQHPLFNSEPGASSFHPMIPAPLSSSFTSR